MEINDLEQFTVSQLTEIFNTFNRDEKPIKAFRSRRQALDRIAALENLALWDAQLRDDGHLEFSVVAVPTEVTDDEPNGQTETVDALEDAVADLDGQSDFVKATKEELSAMDATQRAAYRRRRRAAARTARRMRAGA